MSPEAISRRNESRRLLSISAKYGSQGKGFLLYFRIIFLWISLFGGGLGIFLTGVSFAEAATAVYAPQTATLKNNTRNLICYLGYSQAGGSPAVAGYGYGPKATSPVNSAVEWNLITDLPKITSGQYANMYQLSSYPLEPRQSLLINTAPRVANFQSTYKLINSARMYFYLARSGTCANYSFVLKDGSGDIYSLPGYIVPYAIAEWSIYPNSKTSPFDIVMTFDTSNVDNFELLLGAQITGTAGNAYIGNPVNVPGINTTTAAGESSGNFAAWLDLQIAKNRASAPYVSLFKSLQLASQSNGYTGLTSPTDFIITTCKKDPNNANNANSPFYPQPQCKKLPNAQPNWSSNLNTSYYENEVSAFFTNSISAGRNLVVMGDAQGAYPQQPWKVTSKTGACPILLDQGAGQTKSLVFTPISAATPTLTICNPSGQVQLFPGNPPGSARGPTIIQTAAAANQPQTAQIKGLSLAQVAFIQSHGSNKGIGWNIGQPETGWVGNITGYDPASNTLTVNVVNQNGPFQQSTCVSTGITPSTIPARNNCAWPNTSYNLWVLSNIRWGNSTTWYETASEMVFANDGAFSGWAKSNPDSDQQVVLQSIMRNIVAAFNRGVQSCTNVSGDTAACRRLVSSCYNSAAVFTASDAYWMNEANWFPLGGRQNYYAQYLHVAALNGSGKVGSQGAGYNNIFKLANGSLWATGNTDSQNQQMGLAYGFGYDETPVYRAVTSQDCPLAPVSSKLDPIPTSFGVGPSLTINVGP